MRLRPSRARGRRCAESARALRLREWSSVPAALPQVEPAGAQLAVAARLSRRRREAEFQLPFRTPVWNFNVPRQLNGWPGFAVHGGSPPCQQKRPVGLGHAGLFALSTRADDAADVAGFEDAGGVAVAGYCEHGLADLARGENPAGERAAHDGKQRAGELIKEAIGRGLRLDAVEGFDEAGAEHVGVEWEAEERVLGASFDAGPHNAAFLGAVGA